MDESQNFTNDVSSILKMISTHVTTAFVGFMQPHFSSFLLAFFSRSCREVPVSSSLSGHLQKLCVLLKYGE
ncbi:unnamed protein product [Citrullus colocynthis]|uniref:Uncharacterized protein n=1 Tax=Citrullus colocynthis TaxID=252529 RepID=A0ABP0YIX1_9ROSI